MRNSLYIAAVLLCATSCIYPYKPELDEAPKGVLVVDGNISIGSVSYIRLGTMYSLFSSGYEGSGIYVDEDGNSYNLDDAHVWVEDNEGGIYEGSFARNDAGYSTGGVSNYNYYGYTWFNPLQYTVHTEEAPADREYRACVEAFGDRYASDWVKPLQAPAIKEISFLPDPTNVTVAVTLDGGSESTGYVALSFSETWEFHTDYVLSYEVDTTSWSVVIPMLPPQQPNYWCWKSSNNNKFYPVDFSGMEGNGMTAYPLFTFSRSDNRNHRKYCTTVTARTISKETYKYLSLLDELSGGDGDLFTPNPGEIPGNLRCETDPERMVLGYVTVAQATTKRAFLDSRYFIPYRLRMSELSFITPDKYEMYYYAGFLPLVENPRLDFDPEAEGPYGWGAKYCYDCVAAGGTKVKPDYWDENL